MLEERYGAVEVPSEGSAHCYLPLLALRHVRYSRTVGRATPCPVLTYGKSRYRMSGTHVRHGAGEPVFQFVVDDTPVTLLANARWVLTQLMRARQVDAMKETVTCADPDIQFRVSDQREDHSESAHGSGSKTQTDSPSAVSASFCL
eukprot:2548633-Rhodomonas_salina.3